MKVIDVMKLHKTEREVKCPTGGFTSLRPIVASDGVGFSVTRTTIHKTDGWQMWHYKKHFEACYCIAGCGQLKDAKGTVWEIEPGVMYVLDKHDKHYFRTDSRCVLLCVFNPPLVGDEIHGKDGSYAAQESEVENA